MSNFTPGPWRNDFPYITAPDPKGKAPDIYLAELATEDEEGRYADESQHCANAELMAAAPELFEALTTATNGLSILLDWAAKNRDFPQPSLGQSLKYITEFRKLLAAIGGDND